MAIKKKQKFYVVWVGRVPGVYLSWAECEQQVTGFEGAIFKSFPSLDLAEKAYRDDSAKYIGADQPLPEVDDEVREAVGEPINNSICVDGAWNTRSNAIEYRGVSFPEGKAIFHAGPFPVGTNNIAEFLAIVHALSYCKANNLNAAIYSDSKTALKWIALKKAKTKIEQSTQTEQIRSVIERAEKWLQNNPYANPVLKWHTNVWGEIPADFGRK